MGISCGGTLIKYILFFFNLVWLILGGVVIYLGVTLSTWSGSVQDALKINMQAGSITLLVTGVVIFLLAFLGCCGALKENSCMLSTYGGIILILVVVQCVGIYFSFKYKTKINDEIDDEIQKQVRLFSDKGNEKTNRIIQQIQKTFKCCGISGKEDYISAGKGIPSSCCGKTEFNSEYSNTCPVTEVEYIGCGKKVKDKLVLYLGSLAGVGIAMILIQLLIILMACCLSREARN